MRARYGRRLILFGPACEGSAARASKLRYPLRSASKGKAAAVSPAADAPPTTISAPRRCVFPFTCHIFFFRVHTFRDE
jgi:hypothetical protein